MNGFVVYYDNRACCDDCGKYDRETVGYYNGLLTPDKIIKIATNEYNKHWNKDDTSERLLNNKKIQIGDYWFKISLGVGWSKRENWRSYYIDEFTLKDI